MHLRPSIGGLFLSITLLLTPLLAQTDQATSTSPVTRAVAVYEWTGDLDHPIAARLLPVSLFIHGHLEDAGVYLTQPIPFALQPGNLYLIQHSGQTGVPGGRSLPAGVETIGAINIQSAHASSTPAWAAYGRFLTPTEAAAATTPKPSTTPLTLPADDADTTTPAHPKPNKHKKQAKQKAYVTPPTTPILDDPDRPILQPGPSTAPTTTPELTTLPPDLHQAAAVSDAATRAPQTFHYTWPTPSSHDQTLQSLEALALPHLTHYAAFNHLTPAPTTTTAGPTFANAPAPTLIHAQLLAYTLSDAATPTYILTAESPLTTNGPIYLTLIAQPDATNALHLTLLSITDATHLDRTPWLRPIDAVDPDATGHADLLFELRSQTTRQFALYTLTPTHAEQALLTTPIE
jgi:hypothetical protein